MLSACFSYDGNVSNSRALRSPSSFESAGTGRIGDDDGARGDRGCGWQGKKKKNKKRKIFTSLSHFARATAHLVPGRAPFSHYLKFLPMSMARDSNKRPSVKRPAIINLSLRKFA